MIFKYCNSACIFSKELTNRNMSDTVEPVSDCSPTDLNLRVGIRERMRTIGPPSPSWRIRDSDAVRKIINEDSRRGRNGIYAERKRRPLVTDERFK